MRAYSLMYHDVVEPGSAQPSGFPGRDADLYKLAPAHFEAHLRAISASGGRAARVLELAGARGSAPPFLLTFDDGGASAAGVIADRLDELGWPGHFLVTTDYIGTKGFLTAADIRDLARRGHVIGSHSCSHPKRMSSCTRGELDREWRTSLEVLSDIIGERVQTASIPGGYGSREVWEAAAAAGVRALFTSEPVARCERVGGCLVVGRYTIQSFTPASRAAAIAAGSLAPRLAQLALWNAKKTAKAIGGEHYLRLRKRLLG